MPKRPFYILVTCLVLGIGGVAGAWVYHKNSPSGNQTRSAIVTDNTSAGQIGSFIIGSATKDSVMLNTLAEKDLSVTVEYGTQSGAYTHTSNARTSTNGEPIVTELTQLTANTQYFYRVNYKKATDTAYTQGVERSFYTQRASGSQFSFGVQGDSHPERTGKMFNASLYRTTMQNAATLMPDQYFTLGDDFSIEGLIDKQQQTQSAVDDVYRNQRQYLDIVGSYATVNLVNGNHEQAARYLLDGTATSFPVLAANARNTFYPLPTPNTFFSGDTEQVDHVGYLRDYYAYEWGDALFVVIDPYWHSNVAVDNAARGDTKQTRDLWDNTLGDVQYAWFKKTLETSRAKYKFVFTHHVLGTGRGGTENATLYEWGGYNHAGTWEFNTKRPNWELPIHQLMAQNGVTIFFQGHDHLFAKQERDGVIYQEVPNPADDTNTAFNKDAYTSGTVLPNSGFLHVSVSPNKVVVDYIQSGGDNNGKAIYSYTVN